MEKLAKNPTSCFLLSWKEVLQFLLSKSLDTLYAFDACFPFLERERERESKRARERESWRELEREKEFDK